MTVGGLGIDGAPAPTTRPAKGSGSSHGTQRCGANDRHEITFLG
jgi:hypothetical protein